MPGVVLKVQEWNSGVITIRSSGHMMVKDGARWSIDQGVDG